MKDVVDLAKADDSKLVGGKAASLARLISGGFNVPAGFVVSTPAETKLSEKQNEAILSNFDKLGVKYVAVRSSSAAEDGSKDAWAGQLDTFLNVPRSELLGKIRLCQESTQSDRAKSYAKQKGLKAGGVAVIVQGMIPSDISGVAFSAHPVSANHGQMVIEAVSGLGEKLVSGSVTPDTYVVNKKNSSVIEEHLQAKEQVLSQQQIEELCEIMQKIEKFFGFPIDVEWAYANNRLFILQSRPITTLG